jgi:hypothetical protein
MQGSEFVICVVLFVIRVVLLFTMSRDQNAGRTHSMKIDNSSFERVEEFKYLGTTLTSDNSIQEEIKSRLKSGDACLSLGAEFVIQFAIQKLKD